MRFVYDYEDRSIHYLENIHIGQRIRDIIQLKNGNIVLLTDTKEFKKINKNSTEIIVISNSEN